MNALKKCAEKMNSQWDKLTSVCTDGASVMTGWNVGFCAQLEQFLKRTLHNSSAIALWEVITDERRHVGGREMCE